MAKKKYALLDTDFISKMLMKFIRKIVSSFQYLCYNLQYIQRII